MINPKVFKQVRKALGLTQEELADALGLSRVTINKMERGKLKRGIPDEIAARLLLLRQQQRLLALKPKRPLLADTKPPERAKADDNNLWDNDEEDES